MRHRSGFTLVETLIVAGVIGILSIVVMSFFNESIIRNDELQSEALLQRDLAVSVERAAKVIRGATLILQATETNFKVRSYLTTQDTVVSEVNYYVDNNTWKFSVIPPSGTAPNFTYPVANQKIFTLVGGRVLNSSSTPLFKYYNGDGALLTFPVNTADVKLVEMLPAVTTPKQTLAQPVTLSTKVNLRNLKINL